MIFTITMPIPEIVGVWNLPQYTYQVHGFKPVANAALKICTISQLQHKMVPFLRPDQDLDHSYNK